jgi:hypothetical protein
MGEQTVGQVRYDGDPEDGVPAHCQCPGRGCSYCRGTHQPDGCQNPYVSEYWRGGPGSERFWLCDDCELDGDVPADVVCPPLPDDGWRAGGD